MFADGDSGPAGSGGGDDAVLDHFEKFGSHLPKELWDEYNALLDRLG
ncbi:hypothetical protein [Nonomuraea aridisoli]|nr:hypothetical protein [Nonomuraea aridisoli]